MAIEASSSPDYIQACIMDNSIYMGVGVTLDPDISIYLP